VNDAPNALPDVLGTRRNTAGTAIVTLNDTDIDGDVLAVSAFTQGLNGTVTKVDDRTVRYTPKRNYIGTDSFRYTVSDGKGGTSTANVSVNVTK
jgi:hypothetical protein